MSRSNRKRAITEVEATTEIKPVSVSKKKVKQNSKPAEQARVVPEVEEIDIFEYIKDKDSTIKSLLEGLDGRALESPEKVIEDLFVFLLKAFGYPEVSINLEVDQDLEINVDELLKHIYEINIKKNMNNFPLLARKREVKRFKTNYSTFWTRLVNTAENIVFKTKILENIIKTLVSFAKSKLRTIRYGVAETLGIILTETLETLVKLTEDKKRQESHIEAIDEAAKQGEITEFKKSEEETYAQIKRLSKLTDIIIKEFLKKRYEDAMPEIRVKVIELLTLSTKKIPRLGTDESLLTIVKTLLNNDMEPQVIRVCLDFIDQLAQPIEGVHDKDVLKGMKTMKKDLFTLCFNTNPNIASKAFRFVKAHISALEINQQEIQQLCHLVFYDEEGVASVAADFIDIMYFNRELLNDSASSEEFVFLKKQDESKDQLIQLAKLYELLNPGEIQEEKIEKFVKAFIRKTQIVFDFQGILSLVVEQKPLTISKTNQTTITQNQRKVLLRFALASIRACRACMTSIFAHEKNFKPYAEKILTHASDVIRYRALELLTNLKLENELLTCLLPIFEETDLTLFFGTDNEENYEVFLSTLEGIFDMNKESKVIECIAMLFAKLEKIAIIERDIQEILAKSCKTLLKNFEENFQEYLDDLYIDKKENKDATDGISETLMKFHKLSIYFIIEELAEGSVLNKILEALDTFISKYPVHTDFAIHSLNIFFYVHLWKLKSLLTKNDIAEEDLTDYAKIREKLFEKLFVCFSIEDQMKKIEIPQGEEEGVNNKFLSLEETSFTLIVESLCIVSGDKFNKVPFLFYQPRPELLKALQDYILKLDANSTPSTQSQLFNSTSKKLVQGLRKSKFLARDEDSDSEKDEDEKLMEDEMDREESQVKKDELEELRQNNIKRRVIDQKEGEFFDERFQFACSLITKLFMQCPKILLTDFGVNLVTHFIKSPHENMETLAKVLLRRLKAQELEEPEGNIRNYYWKLIDGVIFKLYHDGNLIKACDVARMASKFYFEKIDKLDTRKQIIICEKYLKYLVNCVLFAISNPKYYDLMGVLIVLTNKSYLDKASYQKLLALFEVELKENTKKEEPKTSEEKAPKEKEEEKIEDMVLVKDKPLEEQELEEGQKEEGDQAMEILEKKDQENEIVEEAQEKSVDKDKADFLDRFRQHMCKITGLKYKRQSAGETGTRKSIRIKLSQSTAKKSARKIFKETKEQEEAQEEEKEEKKEDQKDDESDKENQDINLTEIKSTKKENGEEKQKGNKKRQVKKVKVQTKPTQEEKKPNTRKRKERVYEVEEKDQKAKEEIQDMVKGKQKTKKMKQATR